MNMDQGSNEKDKLICLCYGITECEIRNAILKYSIIEIEEIMQVTGAGAGCGCCHLLLEDLVFRYSD